MMIVYDNLFPIPTSIAVCPECGGVLHVTIHAVNERGEPIGSEIDVDCDEGDRAHDYRHDGWNDVIDRVRAHARTALRRPE